MHPIPLDAAVPVIRSRFGWSAGCARAFLCLALMSCGTREERRAPEPMPDSALSVERYNDSVKAVYYIDRTSGFLVRRWYRNSRPFRIDLVPFTSLNLPDSLLRKMKELIPDYRSYNYKPEFEHGISITVF